MVMTQPANLGQGDALPPAGRVRPLLSRRPFEITLLLVASSGLSIAWCVRESILPFAPLLLFDLLVPLLVVTLLLPFYIFAIVACLWRWRWRKALLIIFAPFVGVAPVVLAMKAGFTPVWVHWQFVGPTYVRKIRELPAAPDGARLARFYWGLTGASAVTRGIVHYIVYDDSGEIALLKAERSSAWRTRVMQTPDMGSVVEAAAANVTRLGGRFYHVTEAE